MTDIAEKKWPQCSKSEGKGFVNPVSCTSSHLMGNLGNSLKYFKDSQTSRSSSARHACKCLSLTM